MPNGKPKFYHFPLHCAECGTTMSGSHPVAAFYHPKVHDCPNSGKFFKPPFVYMEEVERRIPLGLGSRR